MRVIRCDCGFEVAGDGDEELVSKVQEHARDIHGVEVAAELVIGLAKPQSKPAER